MSPVSHAVELMEARKTCYCSLDLSLVNSVLWRALQ